MDNSMYMLEISREEAQAVLPYIPEKDTRTRRFRDMLKTIAADTPCTLLSTKKTITE